jgi:hypothetical protein
MKGYFSYFDLERKFESQLKMVVEFLGLVTSLINE